MLFPLLACLGINVNLPNRPLPLIPFLPSLPSHLQFGCASAVLFHHHDSADPPPSGRPSYYGSGQQPFFPSPFTSIIFFYIVKSFNKIFKPTNKLFHLSSFQSDKNVDNSSRNGRKASKGDRKTPGANDRKTPGGASSRETPVSQTRQTDRRKSASAKRIEEEV